MPDSEKPISIIQCSLPLPIYSKFDYSAAEFSEVLIGSRVVVPFGNKESVAIVMNTSLLSTHEKKLKSIKAVLDVKPVLSKPLITFLKWVADYYMQPIGEVVFLALPSYLKKGAELKNTMQSRWELSSNEYESLNLSKKAPSQFKVLNALSKSPLTSYELKNVCNSWRTTIKALMNKNFVIEKQVEQFSHNFQKQELLSLNTEQQFTADRIKQSIGLFSVHLIDGITGSGKTEVYFDVMQQVIDNNQQVLFMLPEIGLTNAFIKRLCERFGNEIAVIHSGKTAWQRYVAWDQVKRGAAKILVSTRSGVFVDFNDLGLIVIDEEHDSSYRQEDGVYYHGRDCAVKRAQLENIPVLMGSATPSIETLKNCEDGHYQKYELNQRAKSSNLATMRIINTLDKPLQAGCSVTLRKAITQHLEDKGQIILFLNRRGFAPILMCHDCGWRKLCPQCDTQMSLHKSINKMVCHHCGVQHFIPQSCDDCGSKDIQHYGIGTQQLEEKIKTLYPDVLVERIDRDSTRQKNEFDQKLAKLQAGESGIYIGTQMLAKGHDYAGITLVGILNMDQGLHSTQYRATERLAQTVIQVSGRAGRGEKAGEVLLQTDFPEHEIMGDLVQQDYRSIANRLLQERALLNLPPYLKVIMFRADGLSLDHVEDILIKIKNCIEQKQMTSINCVGPFPSYLKKQEGRFRAQMYCHSKQIKELRIAIKTLMPELLKLKKPTHTKWRVDVDPMDL